MVSREHSPNDSKLLVFPSSVTVGQLAQLLNVSPVEVIKQLMRNGMMVNVNQIIDFDTPKSLKKI